MSKKKHSSSSRRPLHCYPEQRYDCISCGKCCRFWEIPVTVAEKQRLEKLKLPDCKFSSDKWFLPLGWTNNFVAINKDGERCIFLDPRNLCLIHQAHGVEAKPLACRLYPLDIYNWADQSLSAAYKFDCPAAASSNGTSIKDREVEIRQLAEELRTSTKPSDAEYNKAVDLELSQLRRIAAVYQDILMQDELPLAVRISSMAQLLEVFVQTQYQPQLRQPDSEFRKTALDMVTRSREEVTQLLSATEGPDACQRLLFSYILSGYVRLEEEIIKLNLWGRFCRTPSVLKFTLGIGSLQELNSQLPKTSGFSWWRSWPELDWQPHAWDPYIRFAAARLEALHVCGKPCLNLDFDAGLRHLVLTYPMTAALTALLASAKDTKRISKQIITEAVQIIDHGFSSSRFFAMNHVQKMTAKLTSRRIFSSLLRHLP